MKILRLVVPAILLATPLLAKTPTQKKNEAKAVAAKAATEQRKQHRESMKVQKEAAKKKR